MTGKKERSSPKRSQTQASQPEAKTRSSTLRSRVSRIADATHGVVEDEVRKGEASIAAEPDQKGEPGSRL